MGLLESGEMYLETILILTSRKAEVRSIDISEEMGFSKPSVSRAVGILKNEGYILVDKAGFISLTEFGRQTAEKIYERHKVITEFLYYIGVAEDTAEKDACKIEHDISDETLNAIKNHLTSIKSLQ